MCSFFVSDKKSSNILHRAVRTKRFSVLADIRAVKRSAAHSVVFAEDSARLPRQSRIAQNQVVGVFIHIERAARQNEACPEQLSETVRQLSCLRKAIAECSRPAAVLPAFAHRDKKIAILSQRHCLHTEPTVFDSDSLPAAGSVRQRGQNAHGMAVVSIHALYIEGIVAQITLPQYNQYSVAAKPVDGHRITSVWKRTEARGFSPLIYNHSMTKNMSVQVIFFGKTIAKPSAKCYNKFK